MAKRKNTRARDEGVSRRQRQTFCERADVYCPRERKPRASFGGLESMALLALVYVVATAVTTQPYGDARGGSAPALKPPRKTQPQPGAADTEADGSAKQ